VSQDTLKPQDTVVAKDTEATFWPVFGGYASFEAGEVVNGFSSQTGELKRVWLESGRIGISADASVSKHLRILIGGEAQLVFSFRRAEGIGTSQVFGARQTKVLLSIKNGEGLYTVGDSTKVRFQLEAGFFPYKYNPDVRNLGEYLFRTYCYPATMLNKFDMTSADLAGLRLSNSFAAGSSHFHYDFLFTSTMLNTMMDFWPSMNWSLSYLADYSIRRLFTIGAGIQYSNLLSVNAINSKSLIGIDPTSPDTLQTAGRKLTFAGTKLMGRASFDVKGLFPAEAPLVSILGKEDLKLYGEAAILGLKNYPDTVSDPLKNQGYDIPLWRFPWMIGINLPAFKALDLLNFEIEYLDSPYPNSYRNVYYKWLPLPDARRNHAKLKWSIYAKKNIGSHCSIIYQMARDHLIPYTAPNGNEFAEKADILLRDKDWWWTGKIQFNF
jgi:hypothetical protein